MKKLTYVGKWGMVAGELPGGTDSNYICTESADRSDV